MSGPSIRRSGAAAFARLSSNQSLLCGTALGCSLLVIAAPQSVRASDECGPVTGAPITCPAGDYPNGVSYSGNTPLVLTVDGVTTTADDRPGVLVQGDQAPVDVTASNISTSGLGSWGVGVTTTSGSVKVKATGVATAGEPSFDGAGNVAEGVFVSTLTGDIDITADDITTDGLYASAIVALTEDADIMIDSGAISGDTLGAVALHARNTVAGSITMDSDSIDVLGQAISAQGVGDISVTSGELIVGDGADDGSTGIYVYSTGGNVTVDSGTLSTSAVRGRGIGAFADVGTVAVTSDALETLEDGSTGIRASARGDVSVASGAVTTQGATIVHNGALVRADGISAESALGDVRVDIDSVAVSGAGAAGVFALARDGSVVVDAESVVATGDMLIAALTNPGGGTTNTSVFSNGVYAQSQTGGDVSVIAGSVAVAGDQGWGVYARAFGGASTVTADSIETGGDGGRGVYAVGLTDVTVDVDSISTSGETRSSASEGVYAWSQTGDVNVDVEAVETLGQRATAVAAYADQGDITVNVGAATTAGAYADGVYADAILGDANVTVGTVVAAGDGAAGVRVRTGAGTITINATDVTTSGDTVFDLDPNGVFAEAVNAYSDSGDISITTGKTTVSGLYASGVSAESQTGDITIDSGEVASTAEGAAAIGVYTYQAGNASVTSGVVNALAAGIQVSAIGDIAIDSGSVAVTGAGRATGVYAVGNGLGDIAIASDTITNASNGGRAIYAGGAGDITIDSGSITSTGTEEVLNPATGVVLRGDAIVVNSVQGGAADVTSGTITTAGPHARGVSVQANGGDVSIDGGDITTAGLDSAGVFVSSTGEGEIAFGAGEIATAGLGSSGIQIDAGASNVAVDVASITTTGDSAAGVFVQTSSGDVTVAAGEISTSGDMDENGLTPEGILVLTDTGAIDVSADAISVVGTYTSAVVAIANSADVTISVDEIHSEAHGSSTVHAEATNGGHIRITSGVIETVSQGIAARGTGLIDIVSGDVTVAATEDLMGYQAIWASSSDGAVKIDSATIVNGAFGGQGIRVNSGGTIDIASESITTTGAAYLTANNVQIAAHGVQAVAAGKVTVDSGLVATNGDQAIGMLLTSNGGDVDVTSGTVTTAGLGAHGLSLTAAGDVFVDSGSITTSGDGAMGVMARAMNGDVTVSSASITTSGQGASGIVAVAGGRVTIDLGDITTSGVGASGVQVEARDLTLNVTGDVVAAQGYGAYVNLTGAGEINLAAGSSLQGGLAGLYLNSTGSSTINILGEIVGLGGQALVVTGAPVTINNNSNTIIGGVTLTDGADTFNNNGTWVAGGTTDFGEGEDSIVNNGLFQIDGAGDVVITGLETFANNGAVDLRNGTLGDTLNLGDATYVGGADSTLLVDVDFATGQSDTLAVASATGATAIVVNNVSTSDGFSPGLQFIQSDTPLTGSEFVLDPASIEDGFIDYDLEFDAATNSYVVKALPSSDSVSMLRAGAAAQDYAAKSGEAWSGRMEDMRDSTFGGVGRDGPTEVWAQILFGDQEMEQVSDFVLLDTPVTRDLSSENTWTGVQMGVDRAFPMAGGQVVVGFTAGFMDYEMNFTGDANRFNVKGYNLGLYGALVMDRLTVSALAKTDRFENTAELRELGARSDFDGDSVDLQAELAYRFGGADLFIEPVTSIDWVKVDLDALEAAGATAEFDDITSLKGRAGLRIGKVIRTGPYTFVPTLGAYAIEQFEGENEMEFTFGSSSYSVTDTPYDAHGRIDLGVSMAGPQGLRAWAKAEGDFGDAAKGVTLRLGARWSW